MLLSQQWIWKERKWTLVRRKMMNQLTIDQLHTEKNLKKEFLNYLRTKATKAKKMTKNIPCSTSLKPRILAPTFLTLAIIQLRSNLSLKWAYIRPLYH